MAAASSAASAAAAAATTRGASPSSFSPVPILSRAARSLPRGSPASPREFERREKRRAEQLSEERQIFSASRHSRGCPEEHCSHPQVLPSALEASSGSRASVGRRRSIEEEESEEETAASAAEERAPSKETGSESQASARALAGSPSRGVIASTAEESARERRAGRGGGAEAAVAAKTSLAPLSPPSFLFLSSESDGRGRRARFPPSFLTRTLIAAAAAAAASCA